MRQILISTLSAIAFSTMVTPAFANEIASLKGTTSSNLNPITPFNLISAGYHGRLKDQGIPSGAIFLAKIRSNRLKAQDLVESAIASGRLTQDALNDAEYLNQVDSLITGLDRI